MFYKGFKQLILNEDTEQPISATTARLTIPGFCDIDNTDSKGNKLNSNAKLAGRWEVNSFPVGAACKMHSITVKLHFEPIEGGDVDGGSARKTFSFVSNPVQIADSNNGMTQADVDNAIADGFIRAIADFPNDEQILASVTAGGGKLTVTGNIKSTQLQLVGASYKTDSASFSTGATILTDPNPGVGLGHQLEASVQLSTYQTRSPYAIDVAGSQPVIVEDKYAMFFIMTKSDGVGFKEHEGLGYGDANTEAMYGYNGYMIAVNENNPALISLIDTFVDPLANLPV
jgi:hypothetical protein